MAIHRSLLRHAASSRGAKSRSSSSRNLTSRSDIFGKVDAKPRPTPSSQLLDAMRPETNSPSRPVPSWSDIFSTARSGPKNPNSSASSPIPSSSKPKPVARQNTLDVLSSMARRMPATGPNGQTGGAIFERSELARKSREIERSMQRQWRVGDVYAPHDLSNEENRKFGKPRPPKTDVFDMLNINPLDEYKNLPLMLDFVTSLGRLKHQRETGLRPVNQRKISRAVRRASSLGLLPRTHAHPEMLRRPGPWFKK